MIFQKSSVKVASGGEEMDQYLENYSGKQDEVDTVVGPSVNVEGDFVSEGNIIVKGSVSGNVRTSKNLLVEAGAKILANVIAGNAEISGEVKGNMKIKESLQLTATAKVLGDVEAKILVVEAGALLYGKVAMPGIDQSEVKAARAAKTLVGKKNDEMSAGA
ncbi:MAG: polymer-forming cytoskeletal protein [Patescibacteria group bacterium]